MRSRLLTTIWIIILILGMAGCAEDPTLDSDTIRASGFVEGRVYKIASGQGGQVVEVMVEQGEEVGAGELLVTLDPTLLEFARDQAQAGVDAAEAALSALQEKPTARDLAIATSAVSNAEAELDAARAARDLLLSGYEPLDPPEIELNAAESAIKVAEAGVGLAEAQLTQVKAGPLEGEQKVLEGLLAEAQANLLLLDHQLDDLHLTASKDGVILRIMSREGEVVSPGIPIIYLMDPDYLTLTLYVPVVKVAKINIGDVFEVTADSYPDDVFYGSVVHIADEAQFTPATVLTQEERVKLVFAIEILLEDPSGKLKPGMPVDAVSQP